MFIILYKYFYIDGHTNPNFFDENFQICSNFMHIYLTHRMKTALSKKGLGYQKDQKILGIEVDFIFSKKILFFE